MKLMPRENCIFLVWILGILSTNGLPSTTKTLNIAVIGAGASGLISAKHALEQGHNVVVYEGMENLGGIWWYTDKSGKDEYGIDIHTAMYQELRTNTPHHLLEFEDHKYPNNTLSYPPHEDVWKYINSYADRYDLKKHIKFHHLVDKVHSIENDKWKIIFKNLPKNKTESEIYDAIFVGINKFSFPKYPQFEGAEQFKGKIMHSRSYRRADDFRGADVLVVGGGPSGRDIVIKLLKTVNRVTWSRRRNKEVTDEERKHYGKIVTFKNNVKLLTSNGAEFLDGTHQNFTDIIYATGYKYSFPILDSDTGIHFDDNYIQPLYKNIINIEHPTMAIISLDTALSTFRHRDLQVRFALKFFSGTKKLPSKSEMLKDMHDFEETQKKKGHPKSKFHTIDIGDNSKDYYKQIAKTADVAKVPDVYTNIDIDSVKTLRADLFGYRKYKYTIIDDETFIKEKEV